MGDWVWGLKMGQGCCGGARATLSSGSVWSEWQEQAAEVRIFTLVSLCWSHMFVAGVVALPEQQTALCPF